MSSWQVAFQRTDFHVVINRVHADLDGAVASDGSGGQGQVQGRVINTGHVAGAGGLVLLGLQREGVHVDALLRHILVVLVGLDQVEVTAVALGEPVVAVQLQLSQRNGVAAALERHGHIHVVGTASGNTGHGASVTVGVAHQHVVGAGEGTVGAVGDIGSVGEVEPLLAEVGGAVDVGVGLANPHQFFHGVVEVQLDLVAGAVGALVASELQLLDQVFVRNLGKAAALVGVQVDVINEQGRGAQGGDGHRGQVRGEGGSGKAGPVAIAGLAQLQVNFAGYSLSFPSSRPGLYLKPSQKLAKLLRPTPVQSLKRYHILSNTKLGTHLRIVQLETFLPLGSGITTVPSQSFLGEVVASSSMGGVPASRCVANIFVY